MAKTLILHIGHFKTGTTALQVFLSNHRRFLTDAGLSYPATWRQHAKHSDYPFSVLKAAGVTRQLYGYSEPTPPQQIWADLFAHVAEAPEERVLISSEEFMRFGMFPAAQEMLRAILDIRPPGVRVEAIAYLRDPGSQVRSWYNQLVKMVFPTADFNVALAEQIEPIHYDYRLALGFWLDLLGPDAVTIRPYRNDRSDPAWLHRDFLAALGVELPEALARIETDPNPRLDDRATEVLRLVQNTGLPRPMLTALRERLTEYLARQDQLGRDSGVEQARARALAGLDWLAAQPGLSVPVESFAQRLPEPVDDDEIGRSLILGFLMSEVLESRTRGLRPQLRALEDRIAALEAQLAATATEAPR